MVYDLMFVPRPTLIGDDDEQWSASDSIAFGAVVCVVVPTSLIAVVLYAMVGRVFPSA